MVQNQKEIILEVDAGWRDFWKKRGIDADTLTLSKHQLGVFALPNIYEHKNTERIPIILNATRQATAVAMVRTKCQSRSD